MRYLITVSYDGSKFYGFQRLNGKNTVQQVIEDSLKKIAKKEILIKGAGRTDRGVHAYAQKCHFDLDMNIEAENLRNALDTRVGDYIHIKYCEVVSDDFHARFNVKEKEYIYKINLGDYDPMLEDYTLQMNQKLDFMKMKKAAKLFVGKHNFQSFTSGKRDNYESYINQIKFVNYGDIIYILFKGQGFFRYMVRNLVGAMLEVGKGKKEINDIKRLLDNPQDEVVLPTAPAKGLYLLDIKY